MGVANAALAPYVEGVALTGNTQADMVSLLTHHGHSKTAAHCLRVGAEAKRIARRFSLGKDQGRAEIAGWLHDVSAVVPNERRIALAASLGLDVLDEERRLPMIVHQKLSAVIARDALNVADPAILSVIGCHTTLKAGASPLDKTVFVADKVAWDQPGEPPYLAEITHALDASLDAAALCYINWLWGGARRWPWCTPG